MPSAVVCAALLHDIEDTPCPPDRIAERFGADIAQLISTVRLAEVSAELPDGLTFEAVTPTAPPTSRTARPGHPLGRPASQHADHRVPCPDHTAPQSL
jgi:hypothetical protein